MAAITKVRECTIAGWMSGCDPETPATVTLRTDQDDHPFCGPCAAGLLAGMATKHTDGPVTVTITPI